ncbi:type IV secretion system protein VirB10 [Phenylobacterium sp.]|uniref:type IV secretion system protein VirB10 n=1 Tax=Phenylobacterium sp. TaxID=1871053 RepID=UPI0025DB23CC|nr:type IV secretion system protein VirB10 [Phenylobacterium sp.]
MTRKEPPKEVSPVFARAATAAPRVRAGESSWSLWAGVAGAGVLGFMVFNGLNSGRMANAQTPAPAPQPTPAAAPAAPVPAPTPAPAPPPPAPMPMAPLAPATDPNEAHWRAPTVVVDMGPAQSGAALQVAQAATTPPGPVAAAAGGAPESADERFVARLTGNNSDVARATQMYNLGLVVPQGTVIDATLETAIDSDLPGSVRGVVSRDVRSFDGSRVLIPRGSKLIGQYKSAVAAGQTRAFVVWTRIIDPSGVTIDVASPATDRLGRGGLDGKVDTHFFRRFGASILLSVVNAGATALANSASDRNTTLVITSPTQANQVAEAALQKQIDIPDTIRVAQGAAVQVFVARDLDFSGVAR